jgi:hypothetical protein
MSMGIADREYMRDLPVHRGPVGHRASWGLAGAVLISVIAASAFLHVPLRLGHGPTHLALPGQHSFALGGPTVVRAGSVMTERGTLPSGVVGTVLVLARWNGGAWMRLASSYSDHGSYFVRFPLDQPGVVDLRVQLPNGPEGVSTVTVTGGAADAPDSSDTA